MKRFVGVLGLGLVLSVAGSALAVVDGARFEREVAKLTLDPQSGRTRLLCVCQDGGANQRHVGYLVKGLLNVAGGLHVTVTCQIPSLAGIDRAVTGTENCSTFEILQK